MRHSSVRSVISCYTGCSDRQEFSISMVTCVIAPEEKRRFGSGRRSVEAVRLSLSCWRFCLRWWCSSRSQNRSPTLTSAGTCATPRSNSKPHAFLHQDFYSFTANGKPWMDHEWLAEIPFYLAWRAFGPRGIFLVTVIAIEIILLGILGLAYLESSSIKAAFVVSFAALFLASVSFGPRTLLFGWMFLVVELGLLARISPRARSSVGAAICLFAVDQYPRFLDHRPGGARIRCRFRVAWQARGVRSRRSDGRARRHASSPGFRCCRLWHSSSIPMAGVWCSIPLTWPSIRN